MRRKYTANNQNDSDERETRINALIEELRAARQRLLATRKIALRNRAKATRRAMCVTPHPPRPVH